MSLKILPVKKRKLKFSAHVQRITEDGSGVYNGVVPRAVFQAEIPPRTWPDCQR